MLCPKRKNIDFKNDDDCNYQVEEFLECLEENCAWWIKTTDNKYNDCSGCAIKIIAEK